MQTLSFLDVRSGSVIYKRNYTSDVRDIGFIFNMLFFTMQMYE